MHSKWNEMYIWSDIYINGSEAATLGRYFLRFSQKPFRNTFKVTEGRLHSLVHLLAFEVCVEPRH